MNQSNCESAWWYWVTDTTTWDWNGFCISPRVTWWTEYISWMDIWSSYSWNRTSVSSMMGNANNLYWVTYNLWNYMCKALWTATNDYDTTDTLVWRMKWLNTNKISSIELDDIDWVSVPSKPANLTVPAIMLADCIDGVRNLDSWYTYEWVTYSQFSSPTNDVTWRQNMNKYLLWWTKTRGSHLPSAYSDMSKEIINNLTINKWEYQIACDAWKFWTVSNPWWNATWSEDHTTAKWILLSSVGYTSDGSAWGVGIRIVGFNGCGSQDLTYAGLRHNDLSARFVVR